jgi:hypothetical protein
LEVALTRRDSIVIYSVSGKVQTVIRLDQPDRLQPFVDLIKGFSVSPELGRMNRELAKEMKAPPFKSIVTTVKELLDAIMVENWRELPVQLGIPSASQVFGQLAAQAGAEAIVYPSKFNENPCIAIYPQMFASSSSYVVLDDAPPRKDVVSRLDRNSWPALSS